MPKRKDYFAGMVIILSLIASIAGILSINFSNSYEFINLYGDKVAIYGSGIYQFDSYFKAPIFIGTDIATLFVTLPTFIYSYIKYRNGNDKLSKLSLISIYAVVLYGAASISFGVTYNSLFLVYVLLFVASLFGMFIHIRELEWDKEITLTGGLRAFLIISGLSTFIAWIPDIVQSLLAGRSLSLIEVYTTEITYVLDIGIISPLCFMTLYLLSKKDSLGTVLLMIILKIGIFVGIVMIPQVIMQYASGIDLPIPVLITKSIIFLLLGGFVFYFNERVKKEIVKES